MRKKIEFNHAWEIARWLEENSEKPLYFFRGPSSKSCLKHSDNRGFYQITNNDEIVSFTTLWLEHTFYIEQSWEETVSEDNPVLCWVWNYNSTKRNKSPQVISSIRENNVNPFISYENGYRKAEPLTLEEAKKYIYECQGGEEC